MALFDAHCHLMFAREPALVAGQLAALGAGALCVTVTPSEYEHACSTLAGLRDGASAIRIGLGLHPWWLSDGRCTASDIEAFERGVRHERRIGEVGLDFSPRHRGSSDVQLSAFRRIARACAAEGGKVLSLHAVHAERETLAILEETGCLRTCQCVFHGFAGPHDVLLDALRAGCFVSVGPRMLASKRGRAYARAIPEGNLAVETDLPSSAGCSLSGRELFDALKGAYADVMTARGLEGQDALACTQRIAHASAALFC